jgi:predicted dehydrogenase
MSSDSSSKVIRWGIVGVGDVTEVKSGPGFGKAEGSALVAVMRRDGGKAADYARRHGVARWYDDGRRLIEDPEVDAVYVATPPDSHEHYAVLAAAAGKPVYVEKPMARTYDECVRMIGAARRAGTKLFVAYYRRSLPRFLKVKELLDAGAIGRVRFVSVRLYQPPLKEDLDPANLPWRVRPEVAGAGRFLDLASHTLDLLDFLLGPITGASGQAANQAGLYPAEDAVTGSWAHEGGALGAGVWCFTTHDREDVVELVGDQGRITFSTFGGGDPVRLESAGSAEAFEVAHPEHIQQPMIQAVVDELLGRGVSPSTGGTAARTSRVMDQMLSGWRVRDVR